MEVLVGVVTAVVTVSGAAGVAWLRARASRHAADADVERARVIADERRDVAMLEHDARVAPPLLERLARVEERLRRSDGRHRDCEARAAECERRASELTSHVQHVEEHSASLARDVQRLARRLRSLLPADEITGLSELRAIERRQTPTPPEFPRGAPVAGRSKGRPPEPPK